MHTLYDLCLSAQCPLECIVDTVLVSLNNLERTVELVKKPVGFAHLARWVENPNEIANTELASCSSFIVMSLVSFGCTYDSQLGDSSSFFKIVVEIDEIVFI